MNSRSLFLAASLCLLASNVPAGQGPAGTSGACANVIGPIDVNGSPIGFTCENVGSSALLVWNASQLTGNINVTGRTPVLSYYAGDFSIDGTFTSNGPLGFIGGAITVNGSITGSSVLLAGAASTPAELKTTLLGTAGRITSSKTGNVTTSSSAKVVATSRNIVIAGNLFSNDGNLTARNGEVRVTTGSKLDIGWDNTLWIEGNHSLSSVHDHTIVNNGTITAKLITLEAHRDSNLVTIINNGRLTTIGKTGTVTFITGFPGTLLPDGTYRNNTFGIRNSSGTISAAKVTISNYYQAAPGADTKRDFDLSDAIQRAELKKAINGGSIFGPSADNTPTNPTTPVIDSTRNSGAFTPTSSIVVPQLAASMSHMNATQQPVGKTLAVTSTSDPVRGAGKPATTTSSKPRPKAKPVLVRGAFFGTKISATLSSR